MRTGSTRHGHGGGNIFTAERRHSSVRPLHGQRGDVPCPWACARPAARMAPGWPPRLDPGKSHWWHHGGGSSMVACSVSQCLCHCPADAFPWWHSGHSLLQVPWEGPLQSQLQAPFL